LVRRKRLMKRLKRKEGPKWGEACGSRGTPNTTKKVKGSGFEKTFVLYCLCLGSAEKGKMTEIDVGTRVLISAESQKEHLRNGTKKDAARKRNQTEQCGDTNEVLGKMAT